MIDFNAEELGTLLDPLREIFGGTDIWPKLAAFAAEVRAPRTLRDLGLKESDLDRAADLTMEASY